eukprot:m.86930 g.86930  ORF g.86930 m.86930 type:complete len:59 (+) comp36520_c0_seq21:1047-1223(+)
MMSLCGSAFRCAYCYEINEAKKKKPDVELSVRQQQEQEQQPNSGDTLNEDVDGERKDG